MKHFAFLLSAALLVCAGRPALADVPSSGYSLSTQSNPAFGSVTCTLPGGDLVTFDGLSIDRWSPAGSLVTHLGSFPAFFAPSFVVPAPSGTFVLLGEITNHELYVAQTDGSGVALLPTPIVFNFAAAFDSPTTAIVSAAAGGFGNGNDLLRVSTSTGAVVHIGHVSGPSGPLTLDATGNLYYATQTDQFPAPPGSTDVIGWTAAQLAAGIQLSRGNATVIGLGFDGGGSLALDPVTGKLYLAEDNYSLASYKIRKVGSDQASSPVVLTGLNWISDLQFVSGGGPASFDAYQPANGQNLRYATTDFSSVSELGTIAPKRPVLTISGPGTGGSGVVTLDLTGGVPNGSAYLLFCKQIFLFGGEIPVPFPGFLFHTSFDLSKTRRVPFYLPCDANGTAQFTLLNPGNLVGLYAYQFLVGPSNGTFVGSSTIAQF
jgi:hypothetical protein